MTYGQLKLRLTQLFPGVGVEILEGFIADRYSEILGELPWSRLEVQAVLQTTAPYVAGTVAVTLGSTAVTGTGTAFTGAMTGRGFRVSGQPPAYTFTQTGATTGTLDRPYEGPTAATASYSIFQSIYTLPANARLLHDTAFDSIFGPMQRFTWGSLNQSDPTRIQSGTPTAWASRMDDSSTPPNLQIELYPVPDTAIGIPYSYTSAAADLTTTGTLLQVWISPTALVQGVIALVKAHLKDTTGAQTAMLMAKSALQQMRANEARSMAPAQFQLGSWLTSHRSRRWNR